MCCDCSCIHLRIYITQCRECTPTLLHLQFPVQDLAQPQCKSKERALLVSSSWPVWQPDVVVFPLPPPPPSSWDFLICFFFLQSCISMHIKALVEEKGCLMLFWISHCGRLGVMVCTICIVNQHLWDSIHVCHFCPPMYIFIHIMFDLAELMGFGG